MTRVRIQISDSNLRQLKSRAAARGCDQSDYVHRILHYVTSDKTLIGSAEQPAVLPDPVYVAVEISPPMREKLAVWSERKNRNIAVFSGALVAFYFKKFERDPRDLSVIYQISLALESGAELTADALAAALQTARSEMSAGLSEKHLVNWFFSRVRPMVRTVARDGQQVEVTIQLIEELLSGVR